MIMQSKKISAAGLNPNPNPNLRMQLAFHFLRALAGINRRSKRPTPSSSRRATSRRIKRAAYASMALAAGPRRAWSRAVLRGLQRRSGVRALADRKVAIGKRIRVLRSKPKEEGDELRELVPGGRRMDFCRLLQETGHYIQCLSAQVRLMQAIADSVSAQNLIP